MPPSGAFAFGPFVLDGGATRLLRDGVAMSLTDRQFVVLYELVSHAGAVVLKDDLVRAAWPDTAVGDNSLAQAMSQIRGALDPADSRRYIENRMGRGYVFVAPVTPVDVPQSAEEIAARLAPYRALLEGRAGIESLVRAHVDRARATFEHLLRGDPLDAASHVGLVNACALQFESTRADPAPDREALRLALAHAHEACRLKNDYAEAYATLGFVLTCARRQDEAIAALRHAIRLQPTNWTHHLRLAAASWGEQRLRAAERTVELFPGCVLTRWLAATVYVGRGALGEAEREVAAGLAALAVTPGASPPFLPVALYWLSGLLHFAQGRASEAIAAFERELAIETTGHIYAREMCANVWYAMGACRLASGDVPAARDAFAETLVRIPHHPLALAGLAIVDRAPDAPTIDVAAPIVIEVTMARAARLVAAGDTAGAARIVHEALIAAPPGNAGWLIPLDPLLGVARDRNAWRDVLALLGTRAC